MKSITIIGTVHKEMGNANAVELSKILLNIKPEVVFVEALHNTYSTYEKKILFKEFQVFHKKLEINAIQLLNQFSTFEYVPVLDFEMPDIFERRNDNLMEIFEFKRLVSNINQLAGINGFKFLNSEQCVQLHEELANLGLKLTNDQQIQQQYELAINDYENNMLNNIYKNCETLEFKKAVFLCGSGHRKSIIDKVNKFNESTTVKINWQW